MGRAREEKGRRKEEERRSEKRKSQKKEDTGARKGRKVAKDCVVQCFVAPEGRQVGLPKRRVRSHWADVKSEIASRFGSQNVKDTSGSEHFWKLRRSKSARRCVHAVVARSVFRSQNVQSTPGSEHFWKCRC